jgi:alpha-L-fucosidase
LDTAARIVVMSNTRRRLVSGAGTALLLILTFSVEACAPTDRMETDDQRMQWWREARFGMFIHWGLYAVPAGEYAGHRSGGTGEWIMAWANIPRAEYERFAPQFNPVDFDAAEWVRIAKDAGMKYIVITSKHHDGFAIYDSDVSAYDVADATPFGRDPLRELAEQARSQELRFGLYYSIMDWHHPSQFVAADGRDSTAGASENEMRPDRKAEYVAYMKSQLSEIVNAYRPDILWFDGEWIDWWTEEDGKDLYAFVRGLAPEIIVNNRVGKGRRGMEGLTAQDGEYAGDFGTPEQQIPPSGLPGVDWESCMTMNDTWGYNAYDDNWKSAEALLHNLIDIASKGGNYLLNVGPTATGRIPEASVERLRVMGHWIETNGDAIFETEASPFATQLPFGRATRKGSRVYLHVLDWPEDGLLRVSLPGAVVRRAYLLADPQATVPVSESGDTLELRVPTAALDSIATVIVLETE